MSDNESNPATKIKPLGGIKEGNFAGMPQQDVDFMVACLRNTIGGSIVVNTIKVAEMLEYKNHRSVTNRLKQMKDRYSLHMSGSTKGSTEETDDNAATENNVVEKAVAKPKISKNAVKARTAAAKTNTGITKKDIGPIEEPTAKAQAHVSKKRKIEAVEIEFPGLEKSTDEVDIEVIASSTIGDISTIDEVA